MNRHRALSYLAPALFCLVTGACTERLVNKAEAPRCSDAELRAGSARSAACSAEFRALMEKAEADAERSSALSRPAKPAPRDRF